MGGVPPRLCLNLGILFCTFPDGDLHTPASRRGSHGRLTASWLLSNLPYSLREAV